MKRNYLTDVLADLVDEAHLSLAQQLDMHLREQWKLKASDEFKHVLEAFESKPSDNAAAELIVYISLTEAMLQDVRTEQGAGGLPVSEADKV